MKVLTNYCLDKKKLPNTPAIAPVIKFDRFLRISKRFKVGRHEVQQVELRAVHTRGLVAATCP